MDDSGERRVGTQALDLYVESGASVDRSAEYLISRLFLDWQRLARHGRLIDVALSRRNATVQRDLFARPHNHDVAHVDLVDRQLPVGAVAAHQSDRRRKIHQRPNRAPRALHRPGLEELRHRKEEDHARSLAPLTEHHRAANGDEHQDVDVEGKRTGGMKGPADAVHAAAGDRREVGRDRKRPVGSSHFQDHPNRDGNARDHHEQPADGRRRVRPDRLFVFQPGAHARLRDGLGDGGGAQPGGVVLHAQALAEHVGVERFEAGQVAETPLEDGDFLVTVHPLDLEDRLGVDLADRAGCRAHRRSSVTCRRPC